MDRMTTGLGNYVRKDKSVVIQNRKRVVEAHAIVDFGNGDMIRSKHCRGSRN